MIYPKFIEKNDTIGICAPSAGIGHKLDLHEESIKCFKKHGFKVKETASVRVDNKRSTTAKKRAQELDQLVCDKSVNAIFAATGGDFMYEILPYINLENIKNNVKWISGMSDPTNLLYLVTTKLDIATLYGHNGSGFVEGQKDKETCLDYLQGNISKQKSYKRYQDFIDTCNGLRLMNKKVNWISKKDCTIEGRLIGGCFEIIEKFLGTEYDSTKEFIERYKDDGIVWYFDIFSMDAYNVYLSLLQMKYAGFFKHCKGILFGRVAFPNESEMKYAEAFKKALGKIPYIYEMDFGHTEPGMTMINGALVKVNCKDFKGDISFKLK